MQTDAPNLAELFTRWENAAQSALASVQEGDMVALQAAQSAKDAFWAQIEVGLAAHGMVDLQDEAEAGRAGGSVDARRVGYRATLQQMMGLERELQQRIAQRIAELEVRARDLKTLRRRAWNLNVAYGLGMAGQAPGLQPCNR